MGSGEQRQLNSIFHHGKSLHNAYSEHSESSNSSKGISNKIVSLLGKSSCLRERDDGEMRTAVLRFGVIDFIKFILHMLSIINFN